MATTLGRRRGRPVRRYVGVGIGLGVSAVLITRFGPLPVSSAARLWEQFAARAAVTMDPQRLLPHHNPPGQAAATYRATTVWCRERAGRAQAVAREATRTARRTSRDRP